MFKPLSYLILFSLLMIAVAHAGTGLPGGTRSDLEREDAPEQDSKKKKKGQKKDRKESEEARDESGEPRPDPSPRR